MRFFTIHLDKGDTFVINPVWSFHTSIL
jgi:hypothetical protein